MDYSIKVSKSEQHERNHFETQSDAASSPLANPAEHPCPACPLVLYSSRELTNHLRCHHNSPRSTDCSGEDEFSCGVCNKVLSSASSLDRHVLVHSGERPFKCKYCQMAFTTNGNMNRHLRTAHGTLSPSSCDSEGNESNDSTAESRPLKRRHVDEYNNNEIAKHQEQFEQYCRSPTSKRKSSYEDTVDQHLKKHKIMLNNHSRMVEIKQEPLDHHQTCEFKCEVCGLQDFPTNALFEAHMERCHPDYAAKCENCNLSFKNHRVLNLHRFMVHYSESSQATQGNNNKSLRNSIVGFSDLTFVDFSSGKFPTIARAVCEQALHRPSSREATKFQCAKCLRAFPCRSALDSHELDCGSSAAREKSIDPDASGRDNFFAGLDLQNKHAMTEAKEGKDLADIQSIISVTSGPILGNFPRSDASTPDHNLKINPSLNSSGSSGTPSSDCHEEEAQDAFAMEFRRMKLKGEFPCRLCSAIFPNLRALKGHNRAHMCVPPGSPFPCNMCHYSSIDKATLIRHLRSHNGDRPYECALCNYAFTTKANCERHVRNRHGKLTREDIKSVLIYHPSQDSTNDAELMRANPKLAKDEATSKKSLVYPTSEQDEAYNRQQQQQQSHHYPLMPIEQEMRIADKSRHLSQLSALSSRYDDYPIRPPMAFSPQLSSHDGNSDSLAGVVGRNRHSAKSLDYDRMEDDLESRSSDEEDASLVSEAKSDVYQRIQASPMDLKKPAACSSPNQSNNNNTGASEDGPLDLSMDVLDLSKKSVGNNNNNAVAPLVKDSASSDKTKDLPPFDDKKQSELYNATNQFLLTQALLKAGQQQTGAAQPPPASSLEAIYANAHLFYRNFGTFPPGVGAGMIPPYLFGPHMFNQDFNIKDRIQKELVRGLQLTSGGTLVEPAIGSAAISATYPTPREHHLPPAISCEPTTNDYAKMVNKSMTVREKIDQTSSSSAVKMVIKNGVLMPKQKQRRYRTERPFTCEHCSARFTLRSNMERHIKQQHPQHWCQRPRGGHSNRGRPPTQQQSLLQNLAQTAAQLSPSYQSILPKVRHHQQQQQPSGTTGSAADCKHPISDQVKYAILAQQLKSNKTEEHNESDEELIIDENDKNHAEAALETHQGERLSSLLRGKLEGKEAGSAKDSRAGNGKPIDNNSEELTVQPEESHENLSEDGDDMSEDEDVNEREFSESKITADNCDESNDRAMENGSSNEDEMREKGSSGGEDGNADLASVSELLDKASQQYQQFKPQYLSDEEGLVASTSDCNNSGSDEKSDSVQSGHSGTNSTKLKLKKKKKKKKKKSAYSMAPNRVICPYCQRPFPWTSSLRRHILTHTGQKPYQCMHCSLLFTTKSNCDRHLLRKHKTNPNKVRRMRNSSSPEAQEVTASNNNNNNNNSTFSMRQVPERPHKCNHCPSSTFSTLGNLKKHLATKHPSSRKRNNTSSRPDSPVSEPHSDDVVVNSNSHDDEQHHHHENRSTSGKNEQSDCESQSSSSNSEHTENSSTVTGATKSNPNTSSSANETPRSRKNSPRSSPGPTDVPFKCHLCDSGFVERQDCLEHIRIHHKKSYEMLVAKGALDMDIEAGDEQHIVPPQVNGSDGEEKRGKFPDYSNRKVVCAFCMRRFWSAEDLRRHMRTHTGERPFSCDICSRRFTLKHSMLRHRKKHESIDSAMYVGTSGDEEPSQPRIMTPRTQHLQPPLSASVGSSLIKDRASLPTVATVATGDAAPSGLMRFNAAYDKFATVTGKLASLPSHQNGEAADNANDTDLISNLLGIRDKSFIDRVLQASADDAAKLLGVKGSHD